MRDRARKDLEALNDIQEAIRKIEIISSEGRVAFFESFILQDAVIRNLEVIGEAVKRLSMELREENTGVPWKRIAGFRDIMIHDYDKVNLYEVWSVLEHDISELQEDIMIILDRNS